MPEEHQGVRPVADPPSLELRADCARCFGLCCVVPAFSASADFAIDKEAGRPCPNLGADFRCDIHDRLRQQGFPGCAVYDCFGAGQQVAQITFGGRDWRREPALAELMFAVFPIMRQLHELLWYLTEALRLAQAYPVFAEARFRLEETRRLALGGPEELARLDIAAYRRSVTPVLAQASELARATAPHRDVDHGGADLIGKDLVGADLRGASLRGAHLIGADLSRADLRLADLAGADLRAASLRGADLSSAIFVTQSQLDASTGDIATRLPQTLLRPGHWSAPAGRDYPGQAPGGCAG